ncbi:F-box/LRR-repeat protein 15-like protein [Drosera capensis]
MHDLDWSFFSGQFSELPITFEAPRFPSMKSISKRAEQPHRLLEHLNCVGCQNIKKVFIPPMACWEQLSYLNLSLSTNLKEVDITCSNLCFLNLSNCCSLEFLKLECPRLASLFLQSCSIDKEAVGSAISRCNMLETLDVRFCPKFASADCGWLALVSSGYSAAYLLKSNNGASVKRLDGLVHLFIINCKEDPVAFLKMLIHLHGGLNIAVKQTSE